METPSVEPVLSCDLYKQVCDDHRFYGDIRFKHLTLWFGATALLANATLSGTTGAFLTQHGFVGPFIGASLAAVFLIMEVSATLHGVEARRKKERKLRKEFGRPNERGKRKRDCLSEKCQRRGRGLCERKTRVNRETSFNLGEPYQCNRLALFVCLFSLALGAVAAGSIQVFAVCSYRGRSWAHLSLVEGIQTIVVSCDETSGERSCG